MVEGPDNANSVEVTQTKNEVPKRKSKEDKSPTKVVIRRLPGTMTEQSFLDHVSPLFENDYFYFVQGDNSSLGEHNYSRAYINFINLEDVFTFTMKFDGYVFIDSTGQEYPAVVEFAPFQRIPKHRNNRKHDLLSGTIEDDPDYKEFVQKSEFEEKDQKNQLTEHYFDLVNDENEEKVTTTPLLEFLTSKKNDWLKFKEEKKEERRRRDLERRKLKEESRRLKKELKEAHKAALEKISKMKDDKKDAENKGSDDVKSSSTIRVKGKSYQEERQRDLARRKKEEKSSGSGDMKDCRSYSASERISVKGSEDKSDFIKEENKSDRGDKLDDDFKKKADDKKMFREDDRRYSYSKDNDKKYGVKKRDSNSYDCDSKYKGSKRDHYYEDFKTRCHNSYQKSSYSAKHCTSSKTKEYDDQSNRRYENKKKYDDFKESKKSYQVEKESRMEEKILPRKDDEGCVEDNASDFKEKSINNSETCSEAESKSRALKGEDKRDDRAERRIKNKDRPAMEIYRPGMGKFSRQRLERNKSADESKDGD